MLAAETRRLRVAAASGILGVALTSNHFSLLIFLFRCRRDFKCCLHRRLVFELAFKLDRRRSGVTMVLAFAVRTSANLSNWKTTVSVMRSHEGDAAFCIRLIAHSFYCFYKGIRSQYSQSRYFLCRCFLAAVSFRNGFQCSSHFYFTDAPRFHSELTGENGNVNSIGNLPRFLSLLWILGKHILVKRVKFQKRSSYNTDNHPSGA